MADDSLKKDISGSSFVMEDAHSQISVGMLDLSILSRTNSLDTFLIRLITLNTSGRYEIDRVIPVSGIGVTGGSGR
jgi:hypothetical protein